MSEKVYDISVTDRNECFSPTTFTKCKLGRKVALDLLVGDSLVFPSDFVFDCPPIDGLMLCKEGIVSTSNANAVLQFCTECLSLLCSRKLPRFALANKLYRGMLPNEYIDLTWVEEMVCAIYRNTAHVTRLYGSLDPAQPTVLHGNTCAHEMNVVSTASVLPRTPSDVNDMISIVFIGAKRPTLESLANVFRVRKKKILLFLEWLRCNNVHYTHIPIDNTVIEDYPEDGVLPGLDECIVHDADSNPEKLFDEETAGFQDHPAAMFKECKDNIKQFPLIEHVGVIDPETVKIPGQTFTAFALHNLSAGLDSATASIAPPLTVSAHRTSRGRRLTPARTTSVLSGLIDNSAPVADIIIR
jgi:hypothetical protein